MEILVAPLAILLINIYYHLHLTKRNFQGQQNCVIFFKSICYISRTPPFVYVIDTHICNNDVHIFLSVALGHDNTVLTSSIGTDQLNWTPWHQNWSESRNTSVCWLTSFFWVTRTRRFQQPCSNVYKIHILCGVTLWRRDIVSLLKSLKGRRVSQKRTRAYLLWDAMKAFSQSIRKGCLIGIYGLMLL